jgi:2-oxo-4-hydroxy-4-carboxy--5-ureidoimidazoline (OHCU) decarboxylase
VISLAELNALPTHEFVRDSRGSSSIRPGWRSASLRHGRLTLVQHLLEAMRTAVEKATPEEQLALIRAHPKLG